MNAHCALYLLKMSNCKAKSDVYVSFVVSCVRIMFGWGTHVKECFPEVKTGKRRRWTREGTFH